MPESLLGLNLGSYYADIVRVVRAYWVYGHVIGARTACNTGAYWLSISIPCYPYPHSPRHGIFWRLDLIGFFAQASYQGRAHDTLGGGMRARTGKNARGPPGKFWKTRKNFRKSFWRAGYI